MKFDPIWGRQPLIDGKFKFWAASPWNQGRRPGPDRAAPQARRQERHRVRYTPAAVSLTTTASRPRVCSRVRRERHFREDRIVGAEGEGGGGGWRGGGGGGEWVRGGGEGEGGGCGGRGGGLGVDRLRWL